MGIIALGPAFESGLWAGRPRGEVLRALCNHADDDRFECWPSYEFIAFTAGIGRSTAAREVRALCEIGLVRKIESGGGRRRSNRYQVNVAAIEACRDRVRAAKRAAGEGHKARMAAMDAARAECEADLEAGMARRMAAAQAGETGDQPSEGTGENPDQNRPAGGRFPDQNRPADDRNRPAHNTETVHGVDPNLQKNLKLEKTRAGAREADPDPGEKTGAAPCGESRGSARGDPGEALSEKGAEPEALIEARLAVIVKWLVNPSVPPDGPRLKAAGLSPFASDADIAEAVTTGWAAGEAGRRAASWCDWAEMILDGGTDAEGRPPKPPIRPVIDLCRAGDPKNHLRPEWADAVRARWAAFRERVRAARAAAIGAGADDQHEEDAA